MPTRAELRRLPRAKRLQELKEAGVPTRDELRSGPIAPRNEREMQMHLSGRFPNLFREPIYRAEKRAWDKFWKLRGRGFTKTPYKGDADTKRRKQRQEKRSKSWTLKRVKKVVEDEQD